MLESVTQPAIEAISKRLDAYRGIWNTHDFCSDCDGSGDRFPGSTRSCETCNGSGIVPRSTSAIDPLDALPCCIACREPHEVSADGERGHCDNCAARCDFCGRTCWMDATYGSPWDMDLDPVCVDCLPRLPAYLRNDLTRNRLHLKGVNK